ncbi:hypothetical protein GGP41_009221 [Bipolaris sorokiniana]|uniref:Uncharacterized protein n=1 Tax=Cochliobolus sativus TaxID=45130 RepID=A0A8H6DU16_COCSA|nr:hypothetical protein GGP41_009221 [Bipolaris sorokiniana]
MAKMPVTRPGTVIRYSVNKRPTLASKSTHVGSMSALLWRQSFFAEGTNSSRCMCVKSYCNHGQDGEIIKMQDCLQQTHGGQIHEAHGGSDERRSSVPRSPRPQLSTKRPLNNSPAKKWSQRQ